MLMTSNDEQPPTPISSISMGRGPRSWPPWSGGPSSCTVWPVPLVALKLALPVQSTVAFIGVSIGYSGMAGNASTVARNRPSCYKLPGTSVKTLTCREKRGYKKISTARLGGGTSRIMATIVKPVEQKTKHLDYFLSQCHRRRYPAKSTIIYAGDKSDSLFYIVKGSVTVIIEDDDGREMIMAYLNAGDFFGEMGLFDNMDSRSAWVKAKTECEVAEISYPKFREIAQQDLGVLYFIGEQMASRLRQTTRKVGDLAFLDVTGRVARTLLDLCKEPDAMTHPDGMQIKITRQEIGRIVGCSREMVGRVLKTLEDQGLVRVKGKTMVVFGTR